MKRKGSSSSNSRRQIDGVNAVLATTTARFFSAVRFAVGAAVGFRARLAFAMTRRKPAGAESLARRRQTAEHRAGDAEAGGVGAGQIEPGNRRMHADR